MKRWISWLTVAVMLISCFAMMAMPASAEGALVNLYDAKGARAGRAVADMSTTNTTELIYLTSAPIEVKSGDVIQFGPCNASQGYQAYFYPKNATTSGAQISGLTEVFKFESERRTNADATVNDRTKNVVVYSYTATADGYIRCTFPIEYGDFFMITKNQPITYEGYYAYFDNKQPNTNLWNLFIDAKGLLNPDGTINAGNNNHYTTHMIPVEPGDTITWGPHQDSMYYGAVGYNADKQGVTNELKVGSSQSHPISAGVTKVATFTNENNPLALSDDQTYSIYSYKVPEDGSVSYVRVVLRREVMDYFQVQKNNVFDVAGYWKLMGGDMKSPYFGAKSLWFGDSITQATQDLPVNGTWHGGWVGRVSKALNMSYDHLGESGWSLSTARPGRIVNRLIASEANEPAGGYDVVMLHGGTNDAWESVAVGEVSDSFYPGDFDITTYAGALEELFYYATTIYGDTAEINYILNYDQPKKMSGQVYAMGPHYAEALKICAKWGVNAIDLFHDQAVKDACVLNEARIYRDWCHANLYGYNILSPFIAKKMLAATNGKAWAEGTVDAEVAADLKASVATDAHFTDASKATFAAATAEADLPATLAAAANLKQKADNRVSILDMTKYMFTKTKEFGVYTKNDLTWLKNYNDQKGNNNNKTNFGNLPGYINEDYTIYLMNDLAVNGIISLGGSNPFKATFDGQNNKIIGWQGSSTGAVGTALFAQINGATIKNIVVDGAFITGGQHTALLVGYMKGTGNLIENCHVVNSTMNKTSGNGMAAIALQPATASAGTTDTYTVRDCTVSNTTFNVAIPKTDGVVVTANYGFIVSRALTHQNIIENCYAYNNDLIITTGITVGSAGGILGEAYCGTLKNCGVYGNTYSVANNAGGGFGTTVAGVVGQVYNATDILYMDNCYSDMADYPLYSAVGKVQGANNFSVKGGNTTLSEITGNALAAKLNAATDVRWAACPISDTVTIPMVTDLYFANRIVKLGDAVFYTGSEDGKIDATPAELEAVAGKIWRRGDETYLTADLMKKVYTENEIWAETEYLLGDCMGGNSLDTADALALLKVLNGKTVEGYRAESADINLDGVVSLLDAVQILRNVMIGKNV